MCVWAYVHMCVYVRACVCVCVRACVCACVCVGLYFKCERTRRIQTRSEVKQLFHYIQTVRVSDASTACLIHNPQRACQLLVLTH